MGRSMTSVSVTSHHLFHGGLLTTVGILLFPRGIDGHADAANDLGEFRHEQHGETHPQIQRRSDVCQQRVPSHHRFHLFTGHSLSFHSNFDLQEVLSYQADLFDFFQLLL